jgi:hypothetical protein
MSTRELHDVQYAAKRLGVSVSNIYRLCALKQLAYVDCNSGKPQRKSSPPVTRHRAVMRFLDEDLDAFIARRRVASVPKDDHHMPQAVATRAAATALPLPTERRFG